VWGPQLMGNVERSIRVWLNVINAIILRDIRVRAGKCSGGGMVDATGIFAAGLGVAGLLAGLFTLRTAPEGERLRGPFCHARRSARQRNNLECLRFPGQSMSG
jgi:hypothetical protein